MKTQCILVPRLSRIPENEFVALRVLGWLVRNDVVAEAPTTCGRIGLRMGYALSEGARRFVEHPDRLPYGQPVNGLEFVTRRCIYTPTRDFRGEAGCPECRREIGEAFFENLDEWMAGDTDHFECPECGFDDEVNNFLFLQPCAFSNLGFIFNGWAEAGLKASFIEQFEARLGVPMAMVHVDP